MPQLPGETWSVGCDQMYPQPSHLHSPQHNRLAPLLARLVCYSREAENTPPTARWTKAQCLVGECVGGGSSGEGHLGRMNERLG